MDLKTYLYTTADQVDRLIFRYFGNSAGELGAATAHLLLAGGEARRRCCSLGRRGAEGSSIDDAGRPGSLSTQLHPHYDDIMDADEVRRGVQTVHTR
jgi:geranylgeranyl pyrophosphate synthase